MKKILVLLFFMTSYLEAQNVEQLFENANKLYQENKFEEAIKTYEEIEAKGVISSEIYYNIGNAYYKLNKVAPTIYNYEKALKIDPLNEDARNNLIFSKRLTIDKIEEIPQSFLQKMNKNYLQKLSFNQWAILTIAFSFLGAVFFLLFYFSDISGRKRFFFTVSIISFILLISSVIITFNQYHLAKNNVEAIIFSETVEVKNEPLASSSEAFTLHEGTKVSVLDEVDAWKKIKLADGKIGWILSEEIKVITLN
jgi:tetratricopeptide (TPR) repeat protein